MKPDKERLEELKEYVNNLSINTSAEFNKQIELLALIDAALTEPDADVANMSNDDIDWLIAYIDGGFGETWQWNKSKRNVLVAALRQYQKPKRCRLCHDEIDIADIDPLCAACINTLEIAQSIQYQKPTDEAVQRAIDILTGGTIYHTDDIWDDPDTDGIRPIEVDVMQTILTALRQMGSTKHSTDSTRATDKCEWIPVTNGRGGHKCSGCNEYAPSYQSGAEWLSQFCPNCGKELVK